MKQIATRRPLWLSLLRRTRRVSVTSRCMPTYLKPIKTGKYCRQSPTFAGSRYQTISSRSTTSPTCTSAALLRVVIIGMDRCRNVSREVFSITRRYLLFLSSDAGGRSGLLATLLFTPHPRGSSKDEINGPRPRLGSISSTR